MGNSCCCGQRDSQKKYLQSLAEGQRKNKEYLDLQKKKNQIQLQRIALQNQKKMQELKKKIQEKEKEEKKKIQEDKKKLQEDKRKVQEDKRKNQDEKKNIQNEKKRREIQDAKRKIQDEKRQLAEDKKKLELEAQRLEDKRKKQQNQQYQNAFNKVNSSNPYYDSNNPQNEVYRSRKDHYQLYLKNKGIHEDYILHPEYFRNCVNCMYQFKPNQQIKIIVLNCGHVLCSECFQKNKTNKCIVYNCKRPIIKQNTKVFDYNKKQEITPTLAKGKNRLYQIVIQISENNHKESPVEQTVQGSSCLKNIVQKYFKLKNFFDKLPNAQLNIKRSTVSYDQIKQMTFDQLSQRYGLIPINSNDATVKTNIIKYYSRYKGGIRIQVSNY